MRKFIILFLTLNLSASDIKINEEKKEYISSLKTTLINKGAKLLDKINKKNSTSYDPQELIVDLRNPTYKNGILVTHEGGVIQGKDIRIQAKSIQYIKRYEKTKFVHRIEAEEDLIIQYKGKVYVGNELEYDFITKTGIVYEGKTFTAPWYLGGDKIELKSDGSYYVQNVFITACENADSTWDLHAGRVNVFKKDLLEAKKVRFRFLGFPTLWLPSFKVNLKKFLESPLFQYKLDWDKKAGPKGSFRYRLYSWKDFALWARVEYRLSMGWGGALETDYQPKDTSTIFQTKNYVATDVIPKDLTKDLRYRIQGVYHSISPSKKTKIDMTWDKFSDINMPSDFKSMDFELNTAKKSELTIRHQEDYLLGILYARPKLNDFDTIKQNLPYGYLNILPFKIPKLNLIFYNTFKTAYLDYNFSDKLSPSLKNFYSVRLETTNIISRAFKNNYFNLTPYVGFKGIYYNKSPNNSSIDQVMVLYGANLNTNLYKTFTRHKHIIVPYINYEGITQPSAKVDAYYVFNIEDGYNKLNLIKTGIKNQVYSLKHIKTDPSFLSDLYANTFLDSNFIPKTLPKLYLDLEWNLPSVKFTINSAWNFFKDTLDFTNTKLAWTINTHFAMSLEFRYRSSYDFRKADHQNFILDISRNEAEIKTSSLSDKRNTILVHAYFRLNPFWSCEIHSHHGWNRKKEPPYNEYKIDLYTMLSASWKVRFSYEHLETDDKFTWALINLIK